MRIPQTYCILPHPFCPSFDPPRAIASCFSGITIHSPFLRSPLERSSRRSNLGPKSLTRAQSKPAFRPRQAHLHFLRTGEGRKRNEALSSAMSRFIQCRKVICQHRKRGDKSRITNMDAVNMECKKNLMHVQMFPYPISNTKKSSHGWSLQ